MLDPHNIQSFGRLVDKPSNTVIITHIFPDPDAIGSSLALSGILESLNHNVSIIVPNPYPEYLKWMPNLDKIIIADSNLVLASKLIESADVIYMLDLAQKHRMGLDLSKLVGKSSAQKVVIDHHALPEKDLADLFLHSVKAAATTEIIFNAICAIGMKFTINTDIANCLYAGLVVDTGSFRYSNTTATSHRIAADLIDLGANIATITESTQNNSSIEKIKFLEYIVSSKLVFFKKHKAAYVIIAQTDLAKFGLNYEDIESVMPHIMSIKNINIAIIAKQMKDIIKLSLRSKGNVFVNKIAIDHFNGGGHRNAAGGVFTKSIEELIVKLETILRLEIFDQ